MRARIAIGLAADSNYKRGSAAVEWGTAAGASAKGWSLMHYLLFESRDKLLRRVAREGVAGNEAEKSSHGIQFMRVWMFLIAHC